MTWLTSIKFEDVIDEPISGYQRLVYIRIPGSKLQFMVNEVIFVWNDVDEVAKVDRGACKKREFVKRLRGLCATRAQSPSIYSSEVRLRQLLSLATRYRFER